MDLPIFLIVGSCVMSLSAAACAAIALIDVRRIARQTRTRAPIVALDCTPRFETPTPPTGPRP